MKTKLVVINYLLTFAVLFSILFQSVHTYSHYEKQLSEKKCLHKYNSSQEITHQHHNFDHCLVCDFTFSNYITTDLFHINHKKIEIPIGYSFFKSREITQFFKGSLFSLRAPPSFIV